MHENKKNKNNRLVGLATITLVSSLFLTYTRSHAENSISQISEQNGNLSDDTQKQIDELNKRAEIYREIIDIKRKQTESLDNQLSIMDTNIQQVEAQIEAKKREIDQLNDQITVLDRQIKEKDTLIASQKKLLGNLIQSYYMMDNMSLAAIYLTDSNLASFMVTKDQLTQTGDKMKSLVESIVNVKKDLESQNSELDKKKAEIISAHTDLEDQSANLESTKQQKQTLLVQTQGEEARYSQLLERVEEQKQELLDIDEFYATSGVSIDDYPKPPASLNAPLTWFYSQKDPRWANSTIGNSNSLMKSYGCAVAAVAMVFTEHGDKETPGTLAKKPIFSWDLIAWPLSWPEAKLTMSTEGKEHGNINWSVIDAQLAKNNPVIVFIKKTAGKGGHYVVIHHKEAKTGKYVVHDPYFGPNLYLDTSRALVGLMGQNSGTVIDQMIIYK